MVFVDPVVSDRNLHPVTFVKMDMDDTTVVSVVVRMVVPVDGLVIVLPVLDLNGFDQGAVEFAKEDERFFGVSADSGHLNDDTDLLVRRSFNNPGFTARVNDERRDLLAGVPVGLFNGFTGHEQLLALAGLLGLMELSVV